jgi:catechol 2,3-dioxygenase-like lactoylglutathione lyase family enzyme
MTQKLGGATKVPIRNNLTLELHIPDFQKARDFYGKFGFEELAYDPTSGGGSDMGYLVLRRKDPLGSTTLNFYGDKPKVSEHSYFNKLPADTPRGYEVEITAVVSDVAGLWEQVGKRLPEDMIAQPLTMKRWNKQDFRVVDPFGFYVRFTELLDWGQEHES